ncbi:MAG TPA: NAD(P)-binding domain-containing protein, partial [Thermoanaerobaculia bacterium]|nr:NAD(P)-binding domain-containing protein [Thermoanaerobaculia bacterium]
MPESPGLLILVGPGRAGRALVRSWKGAGGDVVVIARDAIAAERSGLTASVEVRPQDDERSLTGDFLVVAVPDDSIAKVAASLAQRAACRFSFHLSGALSSSVLAPLSPRSAVGSLHPLRAFTGAPDESWEGSFVAVEGDEDAARAGSELCRRIAARPRRLAAGDKSLYHSAATLAAGG